MIRFVLSLLLAALALALGPAHAQGAAPRAIWTWEAETQALLASEGEAAQAIAFLKAKGIATVYLYADAWRGHNALLAQPERYRRLIKRLHGAGFQVYALLGSAPLHTERYVLPGQRKAALAMLQRVLDYDKAAPADEGFDGINLDIEPHILPEWSTDKPALLAGFLDMSEALMQARAAAGSSIPMGPAIPFWLDGIELEWHGQKKPVSQHVQDIYDYVALMDYRDHAGGGDGLVRHAMDELSYGDKIGKPVLIGIETLPNEVAKVSFHHLAEADLERELAATAASVGRMRSFGGFVVHHYAQYRRWLGLD